MKRLDPASRRHVLWLLDEADRLDKRATDLDGHPKPPVPAAAADMTQAWVEATLGPVVLRGMAIDLRVRAAVCARQETNDRSNNGRNR